MTTTMTKAKIKELKELAHKKYRDEQKKFLVEGVRFVHEAVTSDFHILEAFYTEDVEKDSLAKATLHALKKKTQQLHKSSVCVVFLL